MKELWIDGEYFPDLVDMAKRKKAQAIVSASIDGVFKQIKAVADKNYIGAEVIKELTRVQVALIAREPLFPNRFSAGSIVPVNDCRNMVINLPPHMVVSNDL